MELILASHKFKTGDPHPTERYLAFVEYCDKGHAIWTSIFDDTDAPYRLATKSEQCPAPCRCMTIHRQNSGSSVLLPLAEIERQQVRDALRHTG